jgi:hypothetical protein
MAFQKIKFQTNIPVEMALKFAEGKLCDSQFGDPQYMFRTVDDQVFFVAEKVAQKIHGLRLKPQEQLEIIKAEKDYGQRPQGDRVARQPRGIHAGRAAGWHVRRARGKRDGCLTSRPAEGRHQGATAAANRQRQR